MNDLMFEYMCFVFIGLQYIWEYRSPSKSVPPHYQCKLCKVQRLQNEMAAHITGWKHGFRYIVWSSQSHFFYIDITDYLCLCFWCSTQPPYVVFCFLEYRSRTTKTRFPMRKRLHLKIQPSGKALKLLLLKWRKLREEVKLR